MCKKSKLMNHSHTFGFCLSCPFFWNYARLLHVRPVPKCKLLGIVVAELNCYRPDALTVAQPTTSKHWRMTSWQCFSQQTARCHYDAKTGQEHCNCCVGCLALQVKGEHPSCDNNSVPGLQTASATMLWRHSCCPTKSTMESLTNRQLHKDKHLRLLLHQQNITHHTYTHTIPLMSFQPYTTQPTISDLQKSTFVILFNKLTNFIFHKYKQN